MIYILGISELASIFLGGTSPQNAKFKVPGAVHHARWLAKAIYCLKMFIFRKQFHLSKKELNALREVCVFIVTTYIQGWYIAPAGINAPNND